MSGKNIMDDNMEDNNIPIKATFRKGMSMNSIFFLREIINSNMKSIIIDTKNEWK
jgi:hypothetical protein